MWQSGNQLRRALQVPVAKPIRFRTYQSLGILVSSTLQSSSFSLTGAVHAENGAAFTVLTSRAGGLTFI